jgi:transposase-like protein
VLAAGRQGRRNRLKGVRGRGTLAKEKPPIFGMIERGGQVMIRMLPNVQQATIHPIIEKTVAKGSKAYTDEYNIYARLPGLGYGHRTVCHSRGEYARDEDGDGFCEVHVNTMVTVHLPLRRVRPIDSPMVFKGLAWRNGLPSGSSCDSLGTWDAKTNLT